MGQIGPIEIPLKSNRANWNQLKPIISAYSLLLYTCDRKIHLSWFVKQIKTMHIFVISIFLLPLLTNRLFCLIMLQLHSRFSNRYIDYMITNQETIYIFSRVYIYVYEPVSPYVLLLNTLQKSMWWS